MNDEILKQNLITSGVYGDYVELQRTAFLLSRNEISLELFKQEYDRFIGQYSLEIYQVCKSLHDSSRKRQKRLRRKIEQWSKHGFVYFVTLTFNDQALENSNADTRRQWVRRYLSERNVVFCANQDFGGQFQREHYHAIICSKEPLGTRYETHGKKTYLVTDFTDEWEKKHGFCKVQGPVTIQDDNKDSLKVAKYVSKCSNHALKETALKSSLIYSRKDPSWWHVEKPNRADQTDTWLILTDEEISNLPFEV